MFFDYVGVTEKINFPVLIGFLIWSYYQIYNTDFSKSLPRWYLHGYWAPPGSPFKVYGLPPNWVFSLVWSVLYFLIAVSIFIFWQDNDASTVSNYGNTLLLFFINIILNKLWTPLFFGIGEHPERMSLMMALSILIILGIIATGITILVFLGQASSWVSFGLFIPYTLWTLFAFVLNAQFAWIGTYFYSDQANAEYSHIRNSLSGKLY